MPLLLHDRDGRVYLTHYKPEELPKEMRDKGLLVDQLPSRPALADNEVASLAVKNGKAVWEKEIIEKNRYNKRLMPEEKMDLIIEKLDVIESMLRSYGGDKRGAS
ncbi:MAG: hypothetical protein C4589_09885 [Peptococcaceae bacterium]|nr:MAG: hypothetical protein C4589_09885 [Peptococcaceae bacterium]